MAISDNQKIDYLFKKLGYGATKTDTVLNKLAANESIPSPLLLRGDKVWAESGDIPGVKPTTSTGVITIYSAVEATEDITATGKRTWKTGVTDWVTPEFGSTYLVSVYIHDSNDSANAESLANKVFVTGSGNNDEWFFDYQSGVLNFIGDNLPDGKDFTGKSVYISGAVYSGQFGVSDPNVVANINSDIATLQTQVADILQNTDPAALDSLTEIVNAFQTADTAFATSTELTNLENLLRNDLALPSTSIEPAESFTGDGIQVDFTLNNTPATEEAIDVYVDDVLQRPDIFSLNGAVLTFSTTPHVGADIYVKYRYSFANITAFPNNCIENKHLNLIYTSSQYLGNAVDVDYTIPPGHSVHSVLVIVDGAILPPTNYTISGTTLTISTAPGTNAVVDFRFMPI
jgi:hypothetical protein